MHAYQVLWAKQGGHCKMHELLHSITSPASLSVRLLQEPLLRMTLVPHQLELAFQVGGMLRHLRSLRLMRRDNGWINTLLEEAENERMHLLTFMEMRQPGRAFRAAVLAAQGIMFNAMFVAYLLSPKYVHSLVGYLEEEAVVTYTHAIKVGLPNVGTECAAC